MQITRKKGQKYALATQTNCSLWGCFPPFEQQFENVVICFHFFSFNRIFSKNWANKISFITDKKAKRSSRSLKEEKERNCSRWTFNCGHMAQIGLILLNNGKQNFCILLGHKETPEDSVKLQTNGWTTTWSKNYFNKRSMVKTPSWLNSKRQLWRLLVKSLSLKRMLLWRFNQCYCF